MKEPIVTRTIKSLRITYLAVDLGTHETTTETDYVPAYLKDKEKIFKFLLSRYNSSIEAGIIIPKPVEILDPVILEEELRGMTETDFIKNSFKIERNKKKTEDEEQQ